MKNSRYFGPTFVNVLLICRTNVVVALSEQNSKKTDENICFL